MKRDDLYDVLKTNLPLIKTLAVGIVALFFILLNVYVLWNASSFVPSERTQRWILFHLNPKFWPDWIAQALWMLAAGSVLATFLRFRSIQVRLEKLAEMPFPIRIEGGMTFHFAWIRKLAEYPVERRIFWAISMLFQRLKRIFRLHRLPLLVVILTLLGTGYFVLGHVTLLPRIWPTLFGSTLILLRLPFLLCGWLVVSPLYNLLANGTLSWRLPIAVAVPFVLVMGGRLYGRKIKKYLLRDDIQPLLIRYSMMVGVVYILFLPSLTEYRYLNEFFFRYYDYFIREPFFQYWNDGILSWHSMIFILIYVVAAGVFYFGFRWAYYASDRKKKLRRATILAALMFLLVWFFYVPVVFVLSILQESGLQVYQYILTLPAQAWEGVYDAPSQFLYFSELSWKILVGPVLLIVMILSYIFNPFRRSAKRIRFSEKISCVTLWTLLLVSCFFVIVWKFLLLIGMTLLAYYVAVRDLGMPKIRIILTPEGRKIAYYLLVGLLMAFNLFIVLVDVSIVHRFFGEFFGKPFAEFMTTGKPSWNLLGPVLVLLSVLIFPFLLVLAHYGTKSSTSHREPVHKLFFYGSLAVVLVLLNILCFIRLFTAGTSIPWTDVRLWPWWAMILPVSLIVFSVLGLLLTRKTKSTTLSILFLCFVMLSNTAQAAESRITLLVPARSAQDARKADKHESQPDQDGFWAKPKIVDCFAAMEYHYTGGRYENEPIKFRMRMPLQMEPGKKYPLIVWFHNRGESGHDNSSQLASLQPAMEFFFGPNQQDFFMLATQCPKDNNQWTHSLSTEGKGDAPMTIAGEIMEAVLREFPVDENRISAFGFLSGGTASWEFGRKSPRKLAAFGSCSGNPVKEAKPEEYLSPAIWAFGNSQDSGVPSEDAVMFVDAINAGGGNAFLSLYEASEHNTWTRVMREEKIIGWLILQSLEKPGPPQGTICRPLTGMQQFTRFGLPALVIVACSVPLFFRRKKGVNP